MILALDNRLSPMTPLLSLVRQRVAGPLDSQLLSALVSAAIAFCKRSAVIHYERTFDVVYEGQTVSFAQAASINRQARQDLAAVQVTGAVIHGITAGGAVLQPGEDYHVQSTESILFMAEWTQVCIVGAIEPLPTATWLPTALVENYAQALADGAAAMLQMQADKPWFNPDVAVVRQRAFNDAIRDAYRFRIDHTPNAAPLHPVRRHTFF